jgi:hypothetical protein
MMLKMRAPGFCARALLMTAAGRPGRCAADLAQVETIGRVPMPTRRAAIIAGIALAVFAPLTFAQPSDQPTLASLKLSCSDFKKNQNDSWSPVRTIRIRNPNGTGVKMGPSASFDEGAVFGGVRLAAVLKKECLSH